jgi:DNA-binding Xre family transcriptional regulator
MAKLRINEVAQERGINQSQLQIKSGVTLPLLSRYWRNRTDSVNLDAIEKIARALGVKPGELIVPDEEAKADAA